MNQVKLRLIQPQEDQHSIQMARLSADAFSGGQYVEAFSENYFGNSHYDWSVSRLFFNEDQLVHHWGVWGYPMRLESIQLKVAGIGAVVTHPDYRKQNLMHLAAQSSFDAMLHAGYDLSILRGRHYVKMGYARAWNYVTYRLKVEDLGALTLAKPYQALGVERTNEMDVLYNETHTHFTGTAVRPTFRNRHPEDMGVYAWFDEGGKLEGYIRALPDQDNPKTLLCLEAAGDTGQSLAVLKDVFAKSSCEALACFTLPHKHHLMQYLRRGAVIVENRYFDVSGWRVKLINLLSTLVKLIPPLEHRLKHSEYAGWTGNLLLDAGEQQAALHIEQGRVAVTSGMPCENTLPGGAALARLLIGSDEPDEILNQAGIECSSLVLSLVRVLFPNLHPMLSHWDEY